MLHRFFRQTFAKRRTSGMRIMKTNGDTRRKTVHTYRIIDGDCSSILASAYSEYFEESPFIAIFFLFTDLRRVVHHTHVKNKIFQVKIYIARGKQSQWDFDFPALFRLQSLAQSPFMNLFIANTYKTIHELDPTVWCVVVRTIAKKWCVSYAAHRAFAART